MSTSADEYELNSTIEFNQSIRRRAINQLTTDGKIPEDKNDRAFLIMLLDGSDRTAIQKGKLKIDADDSKSKAKMAAALVEIQRQNRNQKISERVANTAPVLEAEFVVDNPVPGETSTEMEELTYDNFILKNGE